MVLLYGYYVGWFAKENWYLVFIYATIVYIVAILLDIARVKKDVDYINTVLKKKREYS